MTANMKAEICRLLVKLADVNIEILSEDRYITALFEDYICKEDVTPDFSVFVEKKELEEACAKNPTDPEWYIESLEIYRKICLEMLKYDAFLLHSSAISVDGEAYLFAAPSGTGKSTHTSLWRKHFGERAVMVNDDKPIVRIKNGEFYVYGTPYNGQHHISNNIKAPIKAICILSRGERNKIYPLNKEEALMAIINQTVIPSTEEAMDKMLGLMEQVLKKIPIYKLECNISDEAAEVAYNELSKAEK